MKSRNSGPKLNSLHADLGCSDSLIYITQAKTRALSVTLVYAEWVAGWLTPSLPLSTQAVVE